MFTEEQEAVISSKHNRIVCLACAGSGKTTVLIERVNRLISEGISHNHILILTFTNAAAHEMKQRYCFKYGSRCIPMFCTFHRFCYQLILNDANIRKYLKYSSIPQIADESKIKQLETTAKLQTNCKLSKAKLTGQTPLKPNEKFIYNVYAHKLDILYHQHNLITFDMLLESISKLFLQDHPLIQKYKSQYQHILVDEFQDTSYDQWDFVKSFTDADIFVCGDIAQNIYSFRGTTSKIIKQLVSNDSWLTLKLSTNFRSTNQICEFANNIFKNSDIAIDMHGICTGDPVKRDTMEYIPYMQMIDTNKLNDIVELLSNLKGTSAILCRTNKEVESIYDYLADLGISLSSTTAYKDYCKLLKAVYNNDYLAEWLSSLLPIDLYENYLRLCTLSTDKSKLELLYNMNISKEIYRYLELVIQIRKIMKNIEDTNTLKFQNLLRLLEIPVEMDESLIVDNTISAKDVIDVCIRYIESLDISTLYVGTVHSVKGLEFDNVFVIGAYGPTWDIDKDDNRNLFYVACTRAKDVLYVYRGVS